MNIKGHFETITRHKLLVMKYCFACGLYEQGLAHDLSKYSLPSSFRAASIIRVTTAPTKRNVWRGAIPPRGCTTRAATSTIWNTGSTTAPGRWALPA